MTPKVRGADREPVRDLRELRRKGKGSAADFHLLFDALEAFARPRGPLAGDVARTPDLHVAFESDAGETLACVRIRRGKVVRGPHAESASTRVILGPLAARQALLGHPAGVLSEAYFDGRAKVEGRVRDLMELLNLLESLNARLNGEGK
ncbi:MAG: hypothetical protein QXO51_00625 [Halobacteria archaeon]